MSKLINIEKYNKLMEKIEEMDKLVSMAFMDTEADQALMWDIEIILNSVKSLLREEG